MVFFSHRGAKSVADSATGGGQNPYFSTKSQCYHCSFCPGGGAKLHCQFRWGAMAGFAPPGSATACPIDLYLGLGLMVISKFLKRHSKAKRTRAPAYSRVLRRIKRRFPKEGSREA